MRKLLLLPAVGAAAALTYGAAAALNVTGAAPIQVGEETDLVCAEGAEVAGWGYDDALTSVFYAWVDVTDVNANCDGNTLYVTPLDGSGNVLPLIGSAEYSTGRVTLGQSPATPGGDATDRQGNVSRYQVFFGYTTGTGQVDAEDLEGVRLSVDQGPDVDGTIVDGD